jgi:hypothetical protein
MAEVNEDEDTGPRLSGTQKSAILMMLLGEEEAAEVLKKPFSQGGAASWHSDVFRASCRSGNCECGFG